MKRRATAGEPRHASRSPRPFFSPAARRPDAGAQPPFFQPKLRIGPPGDRFEQEADRVADRVVAGETAPQVQRTCTGCAEEHDKDRQIRRQPLEENELREERVVQTKLQPRARSGTRTGSADAAGGRVSPRVASGIGALEGRGQPLPPASRSFFEPRFGRDFGQVRVHTGGHAANLAAAVNARAFTVGSDIVFGAAEYTPNERRGKKLLAHELTHVLQQGGDSGVVRRAIKFDPPTEDARNPIARILPKEPVGLTTPSIEGTQLPAKGYLKAGELVMNALTPKTAAYDASTKECRFEEFDATVSANVIVPTEPTSGGWTMNIPGADVKDVPVCHSKENVPVTMAGDPDAKTVFDWVTKNEQEHVDDLKKAVSTHLDPYYTALMAMRASGDDQGKCVTKLSEDLGIKDGLAAKAFLDDWIASIKTRDDGGGHTLKNDIQVKKDCSAIEIESKP